MTVFALREALVAMRFASAIPAISEEYDFGPAIKAVEGALSSPQPEAVITEDRVERIAQWMALDHVSISDRAEYSWDATDDLWKAAWRKKARSLTAALKES